MKTKTEFRKNPPPTTVVREQLQKILESTPFARAERMKRFLQYTVDQTLRGQASSLKEYSIALKVYDKTPDFDPRLDPIIRVEASRLRAKLREYYETEGQGDAVLISLPKRSYKPQFRFASGPSPKATSRSGPESEAQQLYLKGRYYWNKRAPKALTRAIECFSAAVSKKKNFAPALAGLGDCYASLAWLESLSPGEAWPKAIEAAESALRENPSMAEALTTVACAKALYQWDWEGAESAFRVAIAADDRYATAHHWLGMFCLAPQRRLEEALSELKRARELDPASAIIGCHLGRLHYYRRRYQDAADQLHESIKLDPTLHLAYWHLGFVYSKSSNSSDAKAAFTKAQQISDDALTIAGVGYIHALLGERSKAEEASARLRQIESHGYVSPVGFALIETALGNADNAFRDLQRAIAERSPRVVHLKVEPAFDPLKSDNRFLELLQELKVSD
jgi:tetratricopeptide (TPR) repeat protein